MSQCNPKTVHTEDARRKKMAVGAGAGFSHLRVCGLSSTIASNVRCEIQRNQSSRLVLPKPQQDCACLLTGNCFPEVWLIDKALAFS